MRPAEIRRSAATRASRWWAPAPAATGRSDASPHWTRRQWPASTRFIPERTTRGTTTQGSNGFREFAVGFTAKFPKNYTALGTGEWTFLVNGTRGAGNVWVDDGTSSVTGTAWDIAGFPKTGDASGVQILGRSFVSEVDFIKKP